MFKNVANFKGFAVKESFTFGFFFRCAEYQGGFREGGPRGSLHPLLTAQEYNRAQTGATGREPKL